MLRFHFRIDGKDLDGDLFIRRERVHSDDCRLLGIERLLKSIGGVPNLPLDPARLNGAQCPATAVDLLEKLLGLLLDRVG